MEVILPEYAPDRDRAGADRSPVWLGGGCCPEESQFDPDPARLRLIHGRQPGGQHRYPMMGDWRTQVSLVS